jgi:hypothetical protein
MRDAFDDLVGDETLTGLACAIAIGWSLYQVAHGFALFVDGLTTNVSQQDVFTTNGLTWTVGHRLITLDALAVGLIELAVAVGAAVYLRRRDTALHAQPTHQP